MKRMWLVAFAFIVSSAPGSIFAQSSTATVMTTAPVYAQPDATLTPLRVAASNTRFKLLLENTEWVQVEFNDPQWGPRIGWVQKAQVRIEGPVAARTEQERPLPPAEPPPRDRPAAARPVSRGKLKEIKIRGYVTNVTSPTEFEIEDYRITRDQSFVLDFENDAAELRFRPEEIRVGVEVEVKGLLDEDTGELTAKSMKVDLDQFKKAKHTAVVQYPPKGVTKTAEGWSGWFVVDGQRIAVTPATRVLFKPTSAEKKLLKAAKRRADADEEDEEDDADFVPLQSLDQVTAGMLMSYEGPRALDGSIRAERITVMRNDLEKGEEKLWKSLTPEVKAFNGSKPPELKISRVGKFKLIPDEEVQTYINRVGQSLIPAHQRELPPGDPRRLNFRFFVINEKSANAFALANGTVVVHAGLFTVVDNEAQLAAVVGHEIAHATQEHTWRQMQFHKKKRFALALGAAVASAYGQYGLSDVLNLTQMAIQNGYSRSLENQADRVGLEYLVSAGYDPREAPRVWKNMTRAYGLQTTDFFWSSHDNQATRRSYLMNELKNNYSDLDYSTLKTEPEQFLAIRQRILAASDGKIRLKVKN